MDWIKLWTTSSAHSRRRIKVEAKCKWSIVDIADTDCRQELLLRPDWVRGLPLRLLHVPHQLRAGGAPPPPRPPGRCPVRLLREESVACNKLAVILSLKYQCSFTMIKSSKKCTFQIVMDDLHIYFQQTNPRWAVSRSLLTPPPPRPGGCWCWCPLHWFTPIVGEPEPPGLQNTAGAGSRNGSLLWTLYLIFMPYFATL